MHSACEELEGYSAIKADYFRLATKIETGLLLALEVLSPQSRALRSVDEQVYACQLPRFHRPAPIRLT